MKDIFVPPTPSPINYESDPYEMERSASVLRHRAPEDPYDDSSSYRSFMSSSVMGPPPRPSYQRSHESYTSSASTYSRPASTRPDYPRAPPSRQGSNNSSVVNGSGSENWETYTDASDTEEADATQAYYARQRALQKQSIRGGAGPVLTSGGSVKRAMQSPNPKGGMGKKTRDAFEEGSEAGWTDDGDVGEIY
jgi:protein regulator of cytokinesis 1